MIGEADRIVTGRQNSVDASQREGAEKWTTGCLVCESTWVSHKEGKQTSSLLPTYRI